MPMLNNWLAQNSHELATHDEIPKIGFVAMRGRYPIAVAFMRQCEGNIAMLDGLATDPKASGKFRHEAIDLLVTHIIKIADKMRLRAIIAHTRDASTLERSKKHGFVVIPMTVISKDLNPTAVLCQ